MSERKEKRKRLLGAEARRGVTLGREIVAATDSRCAPMVSSGDFYSR